MYIYIYTYIFIYIYTYLSLGTSRPALSRTSLAPWARAWRATKPPRPPCWARPARGPPPEVRTAGRPKSIRKMGKTWGNPWGKWCFNGFLGWMELSVKSFFCYLQPFGMGEKMVMCFKAMFWNLSDPVRLLPPGKTSLLSNAQTVDIGGLNSWLEIAGTDLPMVQNKWPPQLYVLTEKRKLCKTSGSGWGWIHIPMHVYVYVYICIYIYIHMCITGFVHGQTYKKPRS